MESKAKLKQFFIMVGCIHLDLLLVEKVTVAPIPADCQDEQPCFRYRAIINILEFTDLRSFDGLTPGGGEDKLHGPTSSGGHGRSVDGSTGRPGGSSRGPAAVSTSTAGPHRGASGFSGKPAHYDHQASPPIGATFGISVHPPPPPTRLRTFPT